MRAFFDTEFIQVPRRTTFVSIAIVRDDGRELHLVTTSVPVSLSQSLDLIRIALRLHTQKGPIWTFDHYRLKSSTGRSDDEEHAASPHFSPRGLIAGIFPPLGTDAAQRDR